MGIHYDYKSTRGDKAMKKEAKRKARIEQRRAKRSSANPKESDQETMHDINKPITLEDLSKKFKISRERIRQIENKAFEKLQKHMLNSAKSKNLLPAN